MLGAIFGDVVGSIYEFNNHRSKDFPLLSKDCFFTDDTVLTVAVAECFLTTGAESSDTEIKNKLISLFHKYGAFYPYAGYGNRFKVWLTREETKPYNSFGNGSAMRVSPVIWVAKDLKEAERLAKLTAEITHNHPEGIKGAVATAGAGYLARIGKSKDEIKEYIKSFYSIDFKIDEIRDTYEFNETCQETVPQALVAFLESNSFEDTIRTGISVGGDSDTLCAIAGGVSQAFYGIDNTLREKVLPFLDSRITNVLLAFEKKYM